MLHRCLYLRAFLDLNLRTETRIFLTDFMSVLENPVNSFVVFSDEFYIINVADSFSWCTNNSSRYHS